MVRIKTHLRDFNRGMDYIYAPGSLPGVERADARRAAHVTVSPEVSSTARAAESERPLRHA